MMEIVTIVCLWLALLTVLGVVASTWWDNRRGRK